MEGERKSLQLSLLIVCYPKMVLRAKVGESYEVYTARAGVGTGGENA